MLDQLDVMQAVLSVTSVSTFSSGSSYAIGPIDEVQITTRSVQLSTGDTCTLLVPVTIPPALFDHQDFRQGYEWGYFEGHSEEDGLEEGLTVPKLLNDLCKSLEEMYQLRQKDPGMYPWTPGHILGDMAGIAEWDRTLALTGLAHLCFLLPFFAQSCPSDGTYSEDYYHGARLHLCAIKAYRERIRTYRAQGKSFAEAQRLALR